MRRALSCALSAALAATLLVPGIAAAGQPKVDVCHSEGNGTFHLIDVAEAAYPTHVAHGDGAVGEAVPGLPGYVFGPTCEPVLFLLVRLTSTDPAGVVHLVAQVEDTDGNGAYGPGDTLRIGEFPYVADDDTVAYAPATITEWALDSSAVLDPGNGELYWHGGAACGVPFTGACFSLDSSPGYQSYWEAVPALGLYSCEFSIHDIDNGDYGWVLKSACPSHPSLPDGASEVNGVAAADLLTIEWFVLP